MRRVIIAALALLFASSICLSEATNCSIDANKSDEFFIEQQVRQDGSATVDIGLKIPYSMECIAEKRLQGGLNRPFSCDGKESRISDILFRSIGSLSEKSRCVLLFDEKSQRLVVQASSDIGLAAMEKNGYWEITFEKWNLSTEKLDSSPLLSRIRKRSLRISLPEGAKVLSFFPMSTGSKEGDRAVVWEDFPSRATAVRYTVPEPLEKNSFFLLALLVVVGAAGYFAYGFFMEKRRLEGKIALLRSRREGILKEMKELEEGYLKRRIDEQTYKRMFAAMEIKLGKLRVEREALEKKLAGQEKNDVGEGKAQGRPNAP